MAKTTEEQRAYHRAYYLKRRQACLDYLGGKCHRCDSTDGLVFDHVNPDEKEFEIARLLTLNNPRTRAELDKCQLLCVRCNRDKTAAENAGFMHGTMYGWMKRKCECPECQDAKAIWYKARNAKRRKKRGN